jgi:hypothetical protein
MEPPVIARIRGPLAAIAIVVNAACLTAPRA